MNTKKVMSRLGSVLLFPTRSNIDRIIRWALGDEPRVHQAFSDFMRMGAKSWYGLRVAPPLNLSDVQLRKIQSPALLMLGERDNVIGDARAVGVRTRRLISNIQVEITSDVTHMMSTEKPEFINARILSFLREAKVNHKGEDMIARIWHGVIPKSKADAYVEYINKTGIRDYRATDGNLGVYLLRRIEGDAAHFLTVTFWDSVESIKKFAGEDFEKARYYPEDAEYLLEFEEKVTHYEVMFSAESQLESASLRSARCQS